jgi:hypothetical protein
MLELETQRRTPLTAKKKHGGPGFASLEQCLFCPPAAGEWHRSSIRPTASYVLSLPDLALLPYLPL